MPLTHSAPGTKGFGRNIATEIKAGKPAKQAEAIAYSEAKRHDSSRSDSSHVDLAKLRDDLEKQIIACASPQKQAELRLKLSKVEDKLDSKNDADENGYIAFYKGKKIEVYAKTSYEAQTKAAAIFKAKKSYEVNVVLAEKGGKQVTHTITDSASKLDADKGPYKSGQWVKDTHGWVGQVIESNEDCTTIKFNNGKTQEIRNEKVSRLDSVDAALSVCDSIHERINLRPGAGKMDADNVSVGDKVHLGLGAKGGAGISGTVTKVQDGQVWVKNSEGREWHGPLRFCSRNDSKKDAETSDYKGHQIKPDGKQTFKDSGRIDFNALGETLKKFFKEEGDEPEHRGDSASGNTEYNRGKKDAKAGKKVTDCPYPKDSPEVTEWALGFSTGRGWGRGSKADADDKKSADHKYNAEAVQKEINKDKRIGSKEAKLIHSLLKGRS